MTSSAEAVAQNVFPGAHIEPAWQPVDRMTLAPYYALRLLLGAKVIMSPNGREDYVSLIFEGREFILHEDNFDCIQFLAEESWSHMIVGQGFSQSLFREKPELLRASPEFMISALQDMQATALQTWNVPLEKSRMIWIEQDKGACNHYRSLLPCQYMQERFQEKFYVQRTDFLNFTSINWYDVFIVHRIPSPQMLGMCQKLKAAGKIIVYETDDDFFSIPKYNLNHKHIKPDALHRARLAMDLADLIIVSTNALVDVCGQPEKTLVAPNLLYRVKFDEVEQATHRPFQKEFQGVYPYQEKNQIKYMQRTTLGHKSSTTKQVRPDFQEYDPVRILWAGSNTHDEDVNLLVPAIKELGEKYGMAVRFIFFGYAPSEFLETVLDEGHVNRQLVVKPKYAHFVEYVPPTTFENYQTVLNQINPDIAVCPLVDNEFNQSKSNLKFLEFAIRGLPVLCSKTKEYQAAIQEFREIYSDIRHPVMDLLLCTTKQEWVKSLDELIVNQVHRQYLGKLLQSFVLNKYSWTSPRTNQWDAAFERIHALVQQSRNGSRFACQS